MTGKMDARTTDALQIVLDNSSGCTGMLAMTRAWGERYRAEVWESKVCEIAMHHFIADALETDWNKPGHRWMNPPHNYDEWLQRYKEEYSNEKRPDGSDKDWAIPPTSWKNLYASLKDDYDIASGVYASDRSEPDYERDLEDLRQDYYYGR